jgi:hypothetical protein
MFIPLWSTSNGIWVAAVHLGKPKLKLTRGRGVGNLYRWLSLGEGKGQGCQSTQGHFPGHIESPTQSRVVD